MRSEAYKISGFTVVVSALGFLLRWLQDMRLQSEEGLAINAPISWFVCLAALAAAGILGLLAYRCRQYDLPGTPEEALAGHTPVYGIINLLPALALAVAGVVRLVHPGDASLFPMMQRICGAATLLGAFGAGTVAMNITKPDMGAARRTGMFMMIVFAAVWLVTGYRDAAGDPTVWRYLVEIVAQCVVLLALYYTAGYFFDVPHPLWAVAVCDLGAVLCVMSAIDPSGLAQSVTFAAVAAQLLIWSFVIVENFRTKPLEPVRHGETRQTEQ